MPDIQTDAQDQQHSPQQEARQEARREMKSQEDAQEQSLSFLQIAGSAVAAAFGVQSSRNRERDFSRGKISHFVVAGVVFTAAFVLIMILLVNLVIGGLAG
jgi:hypothetical protein